MKLNRWMLGVLSLLVFRLVPARPFVRVAYEKHATCAGYGTAIAALQHAGIADSVRRSVL